MNGFMINHLWKRFDNVASSVMDSFFSFCLNRLDLHSCILPVYNGLFFIRKLFTAYEGEYLSDSNNHIFFLYLYF